MEIVTEAAQLPEKEYINGIFVAVSRGEGGRVERRMAAESIKKIESRDRSVIYPV